MKPCQSCQTVIDGCILDKQLEPLRELTADDFNVCADCATIVDYCPACRSDLVNRTGHDPGWRRSHVST